MKVKLNGMDYAFWAIFSAMALILLYQSSVYAVSILFPLDNWFARAAFILTLLLLGALLTVGLLHVLPKIAARQTKILRIICEALAALIIGGLFLYHILSRPVDAATYFFIDLVPGSAAGPSGFYDGAMSIYAAFIGFAYSATDNPTLFIYYGLYIMQCLGVLLIFFALRFLSGARCAYLAAIFMAASPYYMDKATYGGTEVLYMLLWSLCFFCMSLWFRFAQKAATEDTENTLKFHAMLLAGFLAGASVYFDISGILLLAAGFYIIYLNKRRLVGSLIFLAGILSGVFIMLFREAVIRSNIISENIQIWLSRYNFNITWRIYVPDEHWIILGLLTIFALMLAVFYPRVGGKSLVPYSFFIFMLMCVFPASGLAAINLNMWLIFAWAAAAGLGLDAVCRFALRDRESAAVDEAVPDVAVPLPVSLPIAAEAVPAVAVPIEAVPIEAVPTVAVQIPADKTPAPVEIVPVQTAPAAVEKPLPRYDDSRGIIYLDNPLPLPRKQPRRIMDYPYEVAPEQMHYDYDVPEDADYDIGARPSRAPMSARLQPS